MRLGKWSENWSSYRRYLSTHSFTPSVTLAGSISQTVYHKHTTSTGKSHISSFKRIYACQSATLCICDMTLWDKYHAFFTCVLMTPSLVCHDSFTCVPWPFHVCAMTIWPRREWHGRHDSLAWVKDWWRRWHLRHYGCEIWLIDMSYSLTCNMTHWHAIWLIDMSYSLTCITWVEDARR